MSQVKLKPFIRENLDVLFIANNPPEQSNENGHYFSGKQSRFFLLLAQSGLILHEIDKGKADIIVFGSTSKNYKNSEYGVIDLVPEQVETHSGKVKSTQKHLDELVLSIHKYKPRFACIIHSDVRDAFNKSRHITNQLDYGACGLILRDSPTFFFLNYFPNGNNITDDKKLNIFRKLKSML